MHVISKVVELCQMLTATVLFWNFLARRYMFYGKDFKYDEDPQLVRKGLISAYPYYELIYNSALDLNTHDPNYGQNPVEVYWR